MLVGVFSALSPNVGLVLAEMKRCSHCEPAVLRMIAVFHVLIECMKTFKGGKASGKKSTNHSLWVRRTRSLRC